MFERLKQAMGLEKKAAGVSLTDPALIEILGGSGPTASGVSVTTATAMRCPAVFGAVRVLAESVASLPIHVYRRTPDGGRERASDHPLEAILSDAANPWTPASEFRLLMATAHALDGNAYAFKNLDGSGKIAELIQLETSAVSVARNSRTLEPVYRVTDADNKVREYSRSEILHIRGVGSSLLKGDSPVALGREAIGLSITLEQHAAGLFGRGARVSGVLKAGRVLGAEAIQRLRSSWDRMYSGGVNGGKTCILEDGMDFTQLQLSSVDAQFLEMRKFQLQEVARLWRVPLHLIGDLDRATFNNTEQMGAQFLSYCLLPLLRTWQDAIRITCLTPEERREYFVEFVVDDLARADLAGRFTAYSQAINAGILNPNEIRAMENRGPYKGGEIYMRPSNTAPAPSAGASQEKAA